MRKRTYGIALTTAAALVGLWLGLGSGAARSSSGCTQVNGHLFNEHIEGALAVGQMVGGINGRYEFTLGPNGGFDPDATALFGTGNTRIVTDQGELRWHESSALDYANEDNYSTAVLATVRGGTGAWAGATGHVIMSGFFHPSTLTGEFDYRGEICTA